MERGPWEAEEAKRTISNNLVFSFNQMSITLMNNLECLLLTGDTVFDAVCHGSICL
jgi:hypothetical protein